MRRSDFPAAQITDAELDAALDAAARLRVGGTYWGRQPSLPQPGYTLIRVRSALHRQQAAESVPDTSVFIWPDSQDPGQAEPDPWHMLSGAAGAIVDADDELALIAAIGGIPVKLTGSGRFQELETGGRAAIRGVLRSLVDGLVHVDPFTGGPLSLGEAIDLCGHWRSLIDSNRPFTAAFGFALWKRPTVAPLLWNGSNPVPFKSRLSREEQKGEIAVWRTRTDPRTLAALDRSGARLVEVEDGFIRSTGLGSDCVPPLSIVADRLGIYFDPQQPSDLEQILREGEFSPGLLARAEKLRTLIVASGIGKYASGGLPLNRREPDRRHLLVPGQVEDDRSVLSGGGAIATNLELLRRVRAAAPDAFIIYKPHPDVVAGHRQGAIADTDCLALADEISRDSPISPLIALVDEVHVNTSLAGFEALLRGKPVTTYGVPFYAGWGLTKDLGSIPSRRNIPRNINELVAAALMLYPRYLDPVTGLPCPAEVMIRRLAEGGTGRRSSPLVRLRRLQGRLRRLVRSPR